MKIAFDVEGPVATPAFDFTWICLDQTSRQFLKRIKLFDEYDDLRWAHERERKGHSTGTTPLVSLLAAACEGFTDLRLASIAGKKLRLSRGAEDLLKWLIHERDVVPYFITSSYPAVPLLIAKQFLIPSSHIYCAGNQLSKDQREIFDRNPCFELELAARSPVEIWSKNPAEAKKFLSEYLDSCIELRDAYLNKRAVEGLLEKQEKIFDSVKDIRLKESLKKLIMKQHGVMGGHNKRKALQQISLSEAAIYVGDGIVDADAFEHAKYGIAINCTNRYALKSCRLNIATCNEALLIPFLEQIITGKLEAEKAKALKSDELRFFTQSDIKARMEEIRKINSIFREAMKQHF